MTTLPNSKPDSGPPPRQIRFVNNKGQPPSKRRRINAACLTCRRRKTRCAGERPLCSTCINHGHQCLGYSEDVRRDGVEPAEARPDEEEDALGGDYNNGDDRSEVANKPARLSHEIRPKLSEGTDAPPVSMAPAAASVGIKPDIEADVDRDHDDAGKLHSPMLHHRQPHASVTSDDLPTSPAIRRTAPSRRIPYFRYFGATAIVPGFKQMVVSVRDRHWSTGGSHSGTSPLSNPGGIVASSSAADSDVVIEDLPAYDPNAPAPVHPLIIQLVTTFFSHVGCNYPFLHQAKFLRHVREKRVEVILVDAVCAIAARFSDLHALTGGSDKKPRTERGQVFAQRARQATVETFPCPSVGAVQACLLMAYEGFGANQDSALWMYLGLAIRMAVDLGLQKRVGIQYQGEKDPWYTRHRSRANDDEDSPVEQKVDSRDCLSLQEQKEVEQERTDTFWSVFVLDRVISSGTGRPVTVRDDDFELPFPERTVDSVTGWPAPFPIFLEIIHLYGRVCDVLNKIHIAQDLTQDMWNKLSKMEHQLTKMYKNWDSRLQFNVGNFKTYLGVGQGTTFILLHFWFHALFIILHQPTLLTPFGELRSELQLLSDSRELSMSSAKTICDILSFADLIDPKSFIGNPFTSQPIYIAACAFLMESSANASEGSSRAGTPPSASDGRPKNQSKSDGKHSRHSLLASAANQNYQRCYNSLQQIHAYWGGVKYILTALDQKAKGKWDCETYTSEEYESTKLPPPQANMDGQFAAFDARSSPKVTGPPIGWSLAGTANSPNSSLTLMYQNFNGNDVTQGGANHHPQGIPLPSSVSPRSMVYDPIRHSIPDPGHKFPAAVLQPHTSAIRNSPRQPSRSDFANTSGSTVHGQAGMNYERIPQETDDDARMFIPPGFTPTSQHSGGYEGYSASPVSGMANVSNARPATHTVTSGAGGNAQNVYHAQTMPYQTSWGPMMGNMDAITFDSQEIDIGALGLQQPDLMSGWLEYIPNDVLALFAENQELGQEGQGAP